MNILILFIPAVFKEIATFPVGTIEQEKAGPGVITFINDSLFLDDRFNLRIVAISDSNILFLQNNYKIKKELLQTNQTENTNWFMKGDTTFLFIGKDKNNNEYFYLIMPSYSNYKRYAMIKRDKNNNTKKDNLKEFIELPEDHYEYGTIGQHITLDENSGKLYIFFTDNEKTGHIWVYY